MPIALDQAQSLVSRPFAERRVIYHSVTTGEPVEAGVIVGINRQMVQVRYGGRDGPIHDTHPANLALIRRNS